MEQPTALEVVDGVDLTGKTCVITGASCRPGTGVRARARHGRRPRHPGGRNAEALADAEAWVRARCRTPRLDLCALDLTSLASVRAAAEAIGDIAPRSTC